MAWIYPPSSRMRRSSCRLRKASLAAASWFFRATCSFTALTLAVTNSCMASSACGAGSRTEGDIIAANMAKTFVQTVRFGENALSLGKHAHAIGINNGDSKVRSREAASSFAMPLPGCFDSNQFHFAAKQPSLELADPSSRVGHTQRLRRRKDVNVEPAFAHVDSCGTFPSLLFGHFLALHAGRAPYHLLRTRAENGRTKLPCGPLTQGNTAAPPVRIEPGGHRAQCTSQLAPSRHSQHAREPRGLDTKPSPLGSLPSRCALAGN